MSIVYKFSWVLGEVEGCFLEDRLFMFAKYHLLINTENYNRTVFITTFIAFKFNLVPRDRFLSHSSSLSPYLPHVMTCMDSTVTE